MHLSQLPAIEGIVRVSGKTKSVILDAAAFKAFLSKIRWEGHIDEVKYMEKYKDVADAVRAGKLKSATSHYIRSGYIEQREVDLVD